MVYRLSGSTIFPYIKEETLMNMQFGTMPCQWSSVYLRLFIFWLAHLCAKHPMKWLHNTRNTHPKNTILLSYIIYHLFPVSIIIKCGAFVTRSIFSKYWRNLVSISSFLVDKSFDPTLYWACDFLFVIKKPLGCLLLLSILFKWD